MDELTTQIEHYMKALHLKGMLPLYRELSERATEGKLCYEEYLALLLEKEFKMRQEGSIKAKIGKAHFPYLKTIEEFDFSFQPSIREKEIIRLGSPEFIERKDNVIFLGPPGVGKTHLSVGLGVKACTKGAG